MSHQPTLFVTPTNMAFMAPGTFRMGSPTTEVDRSSSEGLQLGLGIRQAQVAPETDHAGRPTGVAVRSQLPDDLGILERLDEILASKDEAYCGGVNLHEAYQNGIIETREANQCSNVNRGD